jgi:mannose-6-phosphate isomerase-like protein (cupin superfamily)
MTGYTIVNLQEVEDQAPKFGFSPGMEARFARVPLELENSGLSHFRFAPGFRQPFGHRHERQEEIYVLVGGSARAKIGDEVIELGAWAAVRVSPETMRAFEAGSGGAEILAFGAPNSENRDVEAEPNWWAD